MSQAVTTSKKARKVAPGSARKEDSLTHILARHMGATSAVRGRTKRTAARLAIVAAIHSGDLQPGDTLPSERRLTEILGVSLGTVQAALRQLQEMGIVVRRRGDGSRVGSIEPLANSVWHFRFASKADGTPLRIKDEKLWIDTTAEGGDWSEFVGECPAYFRIRRRLTMQDGTRAGAEMFIKTTAAPGLDDIDPSELGMANLRPYLEETFGIVTVSATHLVKTVSLDGETAERFGLETGANFFEIHAKAFGPNRVPVYFQRIYVSADACALDL